MPKSIQEYLAAQTAQAAQELLKAALEVPDARRAWSPLDKGRTTIDQVAECALLNQHTASVLEHHAWPQQVMETYMQDKAELARDGKTATAALQEHLPRLLAAIRALSDSDLELEIETAFGPMTLEKIMSYPYWNMTYHQGQITYIALLL